MVDKTTDDKEAIEIKKKNDHFLDQRTDKKENIQDPKTNTIVKVIKGSYSFCGPNKSQFFTK